MSIDPRSKLGSAGLRFELCPRLDVRSLAVTTYALKDFPPRRIVVTEVRIEQEFMVSECKAHWGFAGAQQRRDQNASLLADVRLFLNPLAFDRQG